MLRKFYAGLLIIILAILLASDAQAGRRILRVDFGAWSDELAIGSNDCPGTSDTSSRVNWEGFLFEADPFVPANTYLVDRYCQTAIQYQDGFEEYEYLNSTTFFEDEAGLATKVGTNTGLFPVEAIRYTFLDGDRFEPDTQGYQFAFYVFPNGVALATVYGEWTSSTHIDLTISGGEGFIWNGPYDGEYFCFQDTGNGYRFFGTWDGSLAGSEPSAGCESSGTGGFTMEGQDLSQPFCALGEFNERYVDVYPEEGFTDEVLLGAVSLPAGFAVNFDQNPLSPDQYYTPVYYSVDESFIAGTYSFQIQGTAGDEVRSLDVELDVVLDVPVAPSPSLPLDDALNVPLHPNLQWSNVPQAQSYHVEVDDDPEFGSIDFTSIVSATVASVTDRLAYSTTYYWRVSANNACGPSETSEVFSFTTPGPLILRDGFE